MLFRRYSRSSYMLILLNRQNDPYSANPPLPQCVYVMLQVTRRTDEGGPMVLIHSLPEEAKGRGLRARRAPYRLYVRENINPEETLRNTQTCRREVGAVVRRVATAVYVLDVVVVVVEEVVENAAVDLDAIQDQALGEACNSGECRV